MIQTQNPRAEQGARAGMSIAADTLSLSPHRQKIQANATMANRLTWLMRLAPYFEEARL
ncbi:hypothetical protein GGR19_001640 [Croceicoccus naphthovorans]|nr:hypothetical protein [Croceicoccus naphthovorans]